MKIYYSIDEYSRERLFSCVALGFFDGVHLGHRAVIGACAAAAGTLDPVALTFRERPAAALGADSPPLLTGNDEKARLMGELGARAVIFADFAALRDMSPQDFVSGILHDKLRAKKVFCGYNYRFGKGGAGDTETLRKLCFPLGIEVAVTEPVYADGAPVSSTRIRSLLYEGRPEEAGRLLGRPFSIGGVIAGGNRLGASLGFPTINIPIPEGTQAPGYGVYFARVFVGDESYIAAANIGVHPTVGENPRPLCESFLLGYGGGELYGKEARVELLSFIRPEEKFNSTEDLKRQILIDVEKIKSL